MPEPQVPRSGQRTLGATIRDVAQRAGVSQSTVSRVINERGYVSDQTRRRVLEAARALNFRPNFLARSLVQKSTRTLGLVIPDITNPFFPAIVRGVEDAAARAGYTVLLTHTDDDPHREAEAVVQLRERWVDGMIIAPQAYQTSHLHDLVHSGVPTVFIDRVPPRLNVDAVSSDNEHGAWLAVRHLVELGHRCIAHVAGPKTSPTAQARLRGYQRALAEAGISFKRDLVFEGGFRFEGGVYAAKQLLNRRPRPTAVFAANDLMALGVLHATTEAGVEVPHELAVVGFDDILPAVLVSPPLTTVAQNSYDLGARAVELLLDRISGRWQGPGRHVIVSPRLVVRGSCGGRQGGTADG
ncbi:LacI family DNA-binding transcriptional regulator [Thermaerobacter sp. FW80]|uniref:LacI family DNA-binding transcriptional regulator n=1 Tax=Thermaerobacter sp. FW80 TaxID=2546351 RepID=UPI001430926B